MPLSVVREKIQARMSDHAGFICHADKVRRATRDALLLSEFVQRHGLAIKHVGEVAELFMWRHMALTSAAVLTQLTHYIDAGGGSRGARIILDRDGNSIPQTRNGFCDAWRFRSERTEDKKINYLFIIATVSFTSEKHLFVSFLLSEVFGLKKTGLVFLMGQFTSHRMNDIAKVNHYAKYN